MSRIPGSACLFFFFLLGCAARLHHQDLLFWEKIMTKNYWVGFRLGCSNLGAFFFHFQALARECCTIFDPQHPQKRDPELKALTEIPAWQLGGSFILLTNKGNIHTEWWSILVSFTGPAGAGPISSWYIWASVLFTERNFGLVYRYKNI